MQRLWNIDPKKSEVSYYTECLGIRTPITYLRSLTFNIAQHSNSNFIGSSWYFRGIATKTAGSSNEKTIISFKSINTDRIDDSHYSVNGILVINNERYLAYMTVFHSGYLKMSNSKTFSKFEATLLHKIVKDRCKVRLPSEKHQNSIRQNIDIHMHLFLLLVEEY